MEKNAKIYVAGHRGMVGSALVRALRRNGYQNPVLRTSSELDLRDGTAVKEFFASERPEYVFLAAAKVGGILANDTYPADFLYDNLAIQTHVIHNAKEFGVKKLMFLGSSCIYPKHCPQPIKEEYLLTGPLEPTNEAYAIAKIAGLKMCQAYRKQYGCRFITAMPTNLYGPNDNYDLQNSHVLPALIRKFHEAKRDGRTYVELWGDGSPYREFMHADDLAEACLHLMLCYDDAEPVNVGTGEDLTIRQLASMVKEIVGFEGEIRWDVSKPNGTPRKLLDVSRLFATGFRPRIGLREGIAQVYEEYAARDSVVA
ncbi:MAG: GDP-L-fucose synthase [Bacteroidia bacterium]|nr:GDP-L-fucose synthase [Bacteroidia bacterium]MDW8333090.1 GDP-L-fucose synthase [Bacteroidia bacterium]